MLHSVVNPCKQDAFQLSEVEIDEFTFHYSVYEPPHIQNDIITINRQYAADHQVRLNQKQCVYVCDFMLLCEGVGVSGTQSEAMLGERTLGGLVLICICLVWGRLAVVVLNDGCMCGACIAMCFANMCRSSWLSVTRWRSQPCWDATRSGCRWGQRLAFVVVPASKQHVCGCGCLRSGVLVCPSTLSVPESLTQHALFAPLVVLKTLPIRVPTYCHCSVCKPFACRMFVIVSHVVSSCLPAHMYTSRPLLKRRETFQTRWHSMAGWQYRASRQRA